MFFDASILRMAFSMCSVTVFAGMARAW